MSTDVMVTGTSRPRPVRSLNVARSFHLARVWRLEVARSLGRPAAGFRSEWPGLGPQGGGQTCVDGAVRPRGGLGQLRPPPDKTGMGATGPGPPQAATPGPLQTAADSQTIDQTEIPVRDDRAPTNRCRSMGCHRTRDETCGLENQPTRTYIAAIQYHYSYYGADGPQ